MKYLSAIVTAFIILAGCSNNETTVSEQTALSRIDTSDFSVFLDSSYKELLKTYPETVTEMGIDEELGMSGTELDRYDEDFLKGREELERGILDLLGRYNSNELSGKERISYLIYKKYLEDLIESQKYRHHRYLLSYMITSVNYSTENFFTEIIPVRTLSDAEKYITRLWAVKAKMEQVDSQIEIQEEKGIYLPLGLNRATINSIKQVSGKRETAISFYLSFKNRLDNIDLPEEEKKRLLEEAGQACRDSVIPGYKLLEKRLISQQSSSPAETGVSVMPEGLQYYDYTLRHHTNSNLKAEEIHNLGKEELIRIHGEMKALFAELDFDQEEDIQKLYSRLERQEGKISGSAVVEKHKRYISNAMEWMQEYFAYFPDADLEVQPDSIGGYYISPSLDGSRPGTFYASTGAVSPFSLATLTFHETYPGHHYQISLRGEQNVPLFQKTVHFTGYIEGWALYSEFLMAETGYYENDIAGRLGHLQAEAFRAARLVVDTGLHMYGWTIDEASKYFSETTGFPIGFARNQIYRYLVWPGQAASYYTGYMEFRNLFNKEKEKLGNSFSYTDFHDKLLKNGPMPLTILTEEVFTDE